VPMLAQYRSQQSPEEVQLFVNRVSGCLGSILLGVTLLGILIAPLLILIFAPGFATTDGGIRLTLASDMLRITFPYLFFISLTAFAGGILNSYGRFAVPALTPVFLNISMIITTVFLSTRLQVPVMALALGILLGGIVQLAFQLPFLKKIHLLPKPQIYWQDPGVKRILTLMLPALLGVSVNQLNLMFSSVFASFLPVGSVSWLYYAERLMEFPLGGFGVALATVVLPRLSSHHAKAEKENFSLTLDWGVRWVMLVGMPAALGLAILAGPLLVTLFQSGRFTDRDVIYSQSCLIAYALGVMGFMLVKIFASAYYAKQDIKTPVRIAMITVVVNIVLSALFLKPFAHTGLALATSLAALVNAGFLGYGLFKRKIYEVQPGWGALLLRLTLALLAMTALVFYFNPSLEEWFVFSIKQRISWLIILIAGASLTYVATLFLTGLRLQHLLAKPIEEP
jgi:putative peptidoglycan lipid II flippase